MTAGIHIGFKSVKIAGFLLLVCLSVGCHTAHTLSNERAPTNSHLSYDEQLVNRLEMNWYDAVAALPFREIKKKSGKVKVSFILHSDGQITDLKVIESSLDEALIDACKKAVLESAPFASWTDDMIQKYKTENGVFRQIEFTFCLK